MISSFADLVKNRPDIVEEVMREIKVSRTRSMLIKEIYDLYSSQQDKKLRHIFNVGNYRHWLRDRREKHSDLNWSIFRKSHKYVPTMDSGRFAIRLSHLKSPPSDDLYFVLSIARDRYHRQQPVGAWIMSAIKIKK